MFFLFFAFLLKLILSLSFVSLINSQAAFDGVLTNSVLKSWGFNESSIEVSLQSRQIKSIDDNAFN
jgi:hypothetical protein